MRRTYNILIANSEDKSVFGDTGINGRIILN
jgi:hypothetical protein